MTVPLTITRSCRVSTIGLSCVESVNPRYEGRCFRCGHHMPPKPEPVRRNLDLEHEMIQEACRGLVDPSDLIEHAEFRSVTLSAEYVDDPLEIQPGRNRVRDAREELEDCVNHLVFHRQEEAWESEWAQNVMVALGLVAQAYELLKED